MPGTSPRVPLQSVKLHGELARLGVAEHHLTDQDRILSAASFGHLFGLYSVHLALATGATIDLLPIFAPPGLVQLVQIYKATALFTASAHIAACIQSGLFDSHDISSLKLVILSGSAMPPD